MDLFVEIKDFETQKGIIIDMEGPYHAEDKRIGQHLYGATLLVNDVPYHFEKYIPTQEELLRFQAENEGAPRFLEGRFLCRLVPFTK